ncbi:TRAP transporter small permease [Microaerobacter geothermalis]|uniref:TRAP transporter small permease n=1 Tax=Microaerobacter geothermalis TaxID=674972 RepID=UPI001F19DE13|nr:TRAP transporter small permease [Microaerobacter geothermalis]MCF6094839.1 TRAP transporter small permease [Microaerobacter geothermalis]
MGKAVERMNEVMKHILNLLLFVMVIVVFAQVLIRYIFDQPLAWSEELARYILVWITFLGAAYAMSKKAHVGVEIVVKLFPKNFQKIVTVLSALLSLFFFGMMIYQGYLFVERTMAQTSAVLQLPMGGVYFVIPLSGVLISINLIYYVIQELRGEG